MASERATHVRTPTVSARIRNALVDIDASEAIELRATRALALVRSRQIGALRARPARMWRDAFVNVDARVTEETIAGGADTTIATRLSDRVEALADAAWLFLRTNADEAAATVHVFEKW